MSDCHCHDEVGRTRRAHTCAYCGSVIPVGSHAHVEHGVFEGAPYRCYCCDRCWPLTKGFWDYSGGECELPISECFAWYLQGTNESAYQEIFGGAGMSETLREYPFCGSEAERKEWK